MGLYILSPFSLPPSFEHETPVMILGILQARMSSRRLPGKVMRPILGRPVLELQLERLARAGKIDKLIVATSSNPEDRPILDLCQQLRIESYAGALDDVLDRFYQAAEKHEPQYVVRLTGDCPLTDPELIDEVVSFCLKGDFDFVANYLDLTYPDGLDVSIARYSALKEAWERARLPSEREHVTPYITNNPDRFKIGSFRGNTDLSALRWTIDEEIDFHLIKEVYEALYPQNPNFTTQDILRLLEERPSLRTVNKQYRRDEGYEKSLLDDQKWLETHGAANSLDSGSPKINQ